MIRPPSRAALMKVVGSELEQEIVEEALRLLEDELSVDADRMTAALWHRGSSTRRLSRFAPARARFCARWSLGVDSG